MQGQCLTAGEVDMDYEGNCVTCGAPCGQVCRIDNAEEIEHGLTLLLEAVNRDDPKGEIRVRIRDILLDIRQPKSR